MRKFLYLGLAMAAFLLLPAVYGAGNFTLSASPNALAIPAGNSATTTITVTSTNGFSGTVSLSSSVTPNDPTITTGLNPGTVSISSSRSGQSILTVATSPFTPLGLYTVTVTGSSGSNSNPTTVQVQVISSTVGGIAVGSQSTLPTSLSVALIAIGATAAILVGFSGVKTLSNRRNHI